MNSQALLDLGAVSSIDLAKLSDSTITSMLSHIRTLQRNHVGIDFESLTTNTVSVLDKLKDTHGKPLNRAYKRQIAMTIKRLYPSVDINIKPFSKHEQKATTRLMSGDFVRVIGELVTRSTKVIRSAYTEDIADLAIYDTCLTIILTVGTSLRIQEIHDLKMSHIKLIRDERPIPIRSKGYQNLRMIAINSLLDMAFVAIEYQRDAVKRCLSKETRIRANQKHQARFDAGYIIVTSIDFMRKKLRELSSGIENLDATQSFGFNIFRKYITTVVTEQGGHKIAQAMNNHSSESTTVNHYNVVSRVAAEKTYDRIFELIDAVDKPDLVVERTSRKRKSSTASSVNAASAPPPIKRSEPIDYGIPETPAPQPTDVDFK